MRINFETVSGFEWDKHNTEKIWERHKVSVAECEEIFFSEPLVVVEDEKHSQNENRFAVLGRTFAGRKIFAVFTLRAKNIRVISARDQSRKERLYYAKATKSNTKI